MLVICLLLMNIGGDDMELVKLPIEGKVLRQSELTYEVDFSKGIPPMAKGDYSDIVVYKKDCRKP